MNNQELIEEINLLHTPGIEPGHFDWKSNSLPLTYACFSISNNYGDKKFP